VQVAAVAVAAVESLDLNELRGENSGHSAGTRGEV
jgi:hypothetical protein